MKKDWTKWNINENTKSESRVLISKKLKLSLVFFLIVFLCLTNLKIIEVLSLADGKIIPQVKS